MPDPADKGFAASDPRIAPYVERLLEPEDAVLTEIRERSVREGLPPIAVGPFDGRHLEVLARMTGAIRIVEIGTLGGYSGVCLARALPANGILHTLELSPHFAGVAAESFRRAGVAERIRQHVGPALELLPSLSADGPFDLVFIDANKDGYPGYLDWAKANLRIGGTVIADNVFRRAASRSRATTRTSCPGSAASTRCSPKRPICASPCSRSRTASRSPSASGDHALSRRALMADVWHHIWHAQDDGLPPR